MCTKGSSCQQTLLRSVSWWEGERSRSGWRNLFRNASCVQCAEMLFPALIAECRSVSAAGHSCRLPAGNKWILSSTFQLSTIQTQADPLLGLSCSTVSDLLARKNLSYCKILNEQGSSNSKRVLVLKELHPTSEHWTLRKGKKICLLQSSYPLIQNC